MTIFIYMGRGSYWLGSWELATATHGPKSTFRTVRQFPWSVEIGACLGQSGRGTDMWRTAPEGHNWSMIRSSIRWWPDLRFLEKSTTQFCVAYVLRFPRASWYSRVDSEHQFPSLGSFCSTRSRPLTPVWSSRMIRWGANVDPLLPISWQLRLFASKWFHGSMSSFIIRDFLEDQMVIFLSWSLR